MIFWNVTVIKAFYFQVKKIKTSELRRKMCSNVSYKSFQNGDDFGFEYSIKDGRLFLNESNIVIEGIKTNYLDSSSEHIR